MSVEAFVVVGTTGEYSNRSEWLVRAFESEAEAIDYRSALLDTYRTAMAAFGRNWLSYEQTLELKTIMQPLDADFGCDYTGTDWRVERVPFGRPSATKPRVVCSHDWQHARDIFTGKLSAEALCARCGCWNDEASR